MDTPPVRARQLEARGLMTCGLELLEKESLGPLVRPGRRLRGSLSLAAIVISLFPWYRY